MKPDETNQLPYLQACLDYIKKRMTEVDGLPLQLQNALPFSDSMILLLLSVFYYVYSRALSYPVPPPKRDQSKARVCCLIVHHLHLNGGGVNERWASQYEAPLTLHYVFCVKMQNVSGVWAVCLHKNGVCGVWKHNNTEMGSRV